MDCSKIGVFIKELREKQNLTQEQLGEMLGVSRKAISKWECGANLPDVGVMPKLSKCLKTNIESLILGEEIEIKKDDNNFSEFMKLSVKKVKHKCFTIAFIIVVLVLIIGGTLFIWNNFNKNRVYSMSSLIDDYSVNGYLIYNQIENIIILNDIDYQGDLMGTTEEPEVKKIEIFMISDNEIFYSYSYEEDLNHPLSEVLSRLSFSIEDRKKENSNAIDYNTDLEDIYLEICTYDGNEKTYEIKIPLKFDKKFSNDKLLY